MNYLQYIYDAVTSSTSVDVYALAAPQQLTDDYIVITIQGVSVTESKDERGSENINASLFFHFADADEAQNELDAIRRNLRVYPRVMPMYEDYVEGEAGTLEGEACAADALGVSLDSPFTQAYMDGVQFFYDDINERVLLAADFIFIINT
jgi:hypothetical protein|tara:strand:+ start:307 stop:756 length:450 start_codon:yes stop_codon:yes gene_type:complete